MAKQAESTKIKPVKEKRKELEAKGVKERTKTTSPTPQASTPTTKWDPETKKRVRQVARDEVEEADRKKPKVLTAKTPEKGGASSVVGIDMYTASLPTGMPAQSFSRSAAPKPFDVQFRDGKLYVYGPIWNTHTVKLSKGGANAVEGKWNSVGAPGSSTLYAVQEDKIESNEVKSSEYYLAFSKGSDSAGVRYTATEVAKKFEGLGWRSLVGGALITVGGTSVTAVDVPPVAWSVENREYTSGSTTGTGWAVFYPTWVAGNTTLTAAATTGISGSEWRRLDSSITTSDGKTLYAVLKEETGRPETEADLQGIVWSATQMFLCTNNQLPSTAPRPPSGTGSEGVKGLRYTYVPVGKFENGGFTQYHEGVIVTGRPASGGGGGSGGSSWGYGPVEWDNTIGAYVQYKGTFDENGSFTKSTVKTTVIKVTTHAGDHTAGLI